MRRAPSTGTLPRLNLGSYHHLLYADGFFPFIVLVHASRARSPSAVPPAACTPAIRAPPQPTILRCAQASREAPTTGTYGRFIVVLIGDPAQHVPVRGLPLQYQVAVSPESCPLNAAEFPNVVVLERTVRCDDSDSGRALQDIHTAMRSGTTTNAHLTALNARHVGSGTPGVPHSLDDPRLNNAHVSVIVFRNEVRTFIEADLIARQAAATGQQLLSWPIEVRACAGVASRIHSLPHRGFYFRGMRVVFLHRVNVELGIVKNNMGTLVDIALDPREPPLAHSPCVELLNAPRGVYVAVDGCAQQVVDGRPPGVVYIAACAVQGQGVRATMLPYRSIATITDFGAQALTFRPPRRAILDFRPPPTGATRAPGYYVSSTRQVSADEVFLLAPL